MANNNVLTYDSATQQWINKPPPSSTTPPLSTLPDVQLSSQTNGQLLSWNSGLSRWVNSSPAGASINNLGGVNINAPTTNQVLVYGTGGTWQNQNLPATTTSLYALTDCSISGWPIPRC